ARLGGTGALEGIFLITAHYDAIASRDEGWFDSWRSHPAPGANDNGTGVAALLELARLLEPYELPFDVGFILFSAEEIGSIGSADFVDSLLQGEADEILGVLNFDMIGYSEPGSPPGVLVMSNLHSGWLADLAIQSFEHFDQSLVTMLYRPAVPYYDHKSFWNRSISAITFSEPYSEDYRIIFPYYHTEMDTIGRIDFDQVERITEAAGNFLVELSDSEGECAMLASDLHFNWKGYTTTRRSFSAGDTLLLEFRPRNIGAADPPVEAGLRLDVTIESRNGRESIHSSTYMPPKSFRSLLVEIPVILEERDAGEKRVRARISVSGMPDDPSNNETVETFSVSGGSQVVLDHRFQPNPIRSSFPDASFCVDLSREAELKVELLNLEGELLGRAFIGSGSGKPLSAGLNCFGCGDLFPGIERLSGGVYFYRL
ncbi:MAG: M20/M25/M40 family metallo-hydrolase, partial [Candidatus Krumholzibacteria bacterium]|nr:M20/M25/M40 family metallo-hydrolase [Candidatus Krumholzibacteria bacterium]